MKLKMNHRHRSWPVALTGIVEKALREYAIDFSSEKDLAKIAKAVLQLSDIYNSKKGGPKIWQEPIFCAAYLSYFFPLNCLRILEVLQSFPADKFFAKFERWIDFGSGVGTFEIAHALWRAEQVATHPERKDFLQKGTMVSKIESSLEAQSLHRKLQQFLIEELGKGLETSSEDRLPEFESPFVELQSLEVRPKTLAVFSYSLNEWILQNPGSLLPPWAKDAEGILWIEPSDQALGRKLQNSRALLLEEGFQIWAPCTHQLACSMQTQSATDWCHQRFLIDRPQWFLDLERHLPMHNNSLTFTYMAAMKSESSPTQGLIRVVGDTLIEKGKLRQRVCRNDQREYFSWLTRNKTPQELQSLLIASGNLVEALSNETKSGEEIRLTSN